MYQTIALHALQKPGAGASALKTRVQTLEPGLAGGKRAAGEEAVRKEKRFGSEDGKPLPSCGAVSPFTNLSVVSIRSLFLPAVRLEPLPSAGDSPRLGFWEE